MPEENCPQSKAWCPHRREDCHDVEEGHHDRCIHVRAALHAAMALSLIAALPKEQRVTTRDLIDSEVNAVEGELARMDRGGGQP